MISIGMYVSRLLELLVRAPRVQSLSPLPAHEVTKDSPPGRICPGSDESLNANIFVQPDGPVRAVAAVDFKLLS